MRPDIIVRVSGQDVVSNLLDLHLRQVPRVLRLGDEIVSKTASHLLDTHAAVSTRCRSRGGLRSRNLLLVQHMPELIRALDLLLRVQHPVHRLLDALAPKHFTPQGPLLQEIDEHSPPIREAQVAMKNASLVFPVYTPEIHGHPFEGQEIPGPPAEVAGAEGVVAAEVEVIFVETEERGGGCSAEGRALALLVAAEVEHYADSLCSGVNVPDVDLSRKGP